MLADTAATTTMCPSGAQLRTGGTRGSEYPAHWGLGGGDQGRGHSLSPSRHTPSSQVPWQGVTYNDTAEREHRRMRGYPPEPDSRWEDAGDDWSVGMGGRWVGDGMGGRWVGDDSPRAHEYHGGTRERDGHTRGPRTIPVNAEVKMVKPYTGEPGKGPALKHYLADLQGVTARWRANGFSMRVFFCQLGPTLDGEAKNFYIDEMAAILRQHEQGSEGNVALDRDGQPILLRDPTHLWARMLKVRFCRVTAERLQEFERFQGKFNEGRHEHVRAPGPAGSGA